MVKALPSRSHASAPESASLLHTKQRFQPQQARHAAVIYRANYITQSPGCANTYTYNSANRLSTYTGSSGTVSYAYDGLGNRLKETINGQTTTFTMDLDSGLSQTLDDGTNTYLYDNGRIAQVDQTGIQYFLGDALDSAERPVNGCQWRADTRSGL